MLLVALMGLPGCWPSPPAPPPPDPPEAHTDVPGPTRAPIPDIVPSEPRYAATHVLIAWSGAVDAPASVARTEAEAERIAMDLHARALGGEPLEALARAHSDGPSAPRGGRLGVYATGTMVPDFERAIASVEVGAIAPIVRSPFGFHVARRDPVIEYRLWHTQIAFAGAWRSEATRSKEQARARAEQALAALEAGTPPDQVARSFSDDPTASLNGGDLGLVAPGQLVPAFEEVAFALEEGATSEIIETSYGFHIVRRLNDAR